MNLSQAFLRLARRATRPLTFLFVLSVSALPGMAGSDTPQAPISLPATDVDKLVGGTVTFTGGVATGCTWDFGDGSAPVSAQTATHAYATPGPHTATYTVKVRNRYYDSTDPSSGPPYFTYTSTRVVTTWYPVAISKLTANQSSGPISVRATSPVALEWATTNATTLSMMGNVDLGSVTGLTSITYNPTSATTYTLTAKNPASSATLSVSVSTYVVGVSVNPGTLSLNLGQSQALTAAVTQSAQNVNWTTTATPAQGTLSATTGSTVTFLGKASGTYNVVATSIEDSTKFANATVTVASVAVSPLTPPAPTIDAGLDVNFTSSVIGAVDAGLTWKVSGGGAIDATGRFHATQAGSWTVTATSTADPTKSASTQIVVRPVITGVALNPTELTLAVGKSATFQAVASGIGGGSTAVTWSCSAGSIDASGTFTAPTQGGDVTVTATSVTDPTKTRTALVHVQAWVLKWKKDIVYLGTKELAEIDNSGKTWVTFVDHLGSPRIIWDGTANPVQGENVIEQKFMPFGESLTMDSASASKFAKGFTNHEQTDPSGLIYMQARFYAPWFGRFLSPDPARDQHFEQTQSWNIYSYVQNDPTMRIDPTGMVGMIDLDGLRNWAKKKWEQGEKAIGKASTSVNNATKSLWNKMTGGDKKSVSGGKTDAAGVTPGRKIWISKTPDGGDNKGTRVDDGHGNNKGECVSLAKHDNPGMPGTKSWHLGIPVQGNEDKIKPGTIVGEMNNGKDWKDRGHVGEYLRGDSKGFTMTDQYNTGKGHDIGPSHFTWEGRGADHPQSQGKRYHVIETGP